MGVELFIARPEMQEVVSIGTVIFIKPFQPEESV
jgi:hypothetical protein